MECKDIEQKVEMYLEDDMHYKELDKFLIHIENCKECREELEIKYIIKYGLSDEYDEHSGSYNFMELIDEDLAKARKRVNRNVKARKFLGGLWIVTNAVVGVAMLYVLYVRGFF